jgi:hypothetical protein
MILKRSFCPLVSELGIYKTLSLGLNAHVIFMETMNNKLHRFLDNSLLVFIDGILLLKDRRRAWWSLEACA